MARAPDRAIDTDSGFRSGARVEAQALVPFRSSRQRAMAGSEAHPRAAPDRRDRPDFLDHGVN
jgi:hypothetical protein